MKFNFSSLGEQSIAVCDKCGTLWRLSAGLKTKICNACSINLPVYPAKKWEDKMNDLLKIYKIGTKVKATKFANKWRSVLDGVVGIISRINYTDYFFPFAVTFDGKNYSKKVTFLDIVPFDSNEKWRQVIF